jgi:hypothetical protein
MGKRSKVRKIVIIGDSPLTGAISRRIQVYFGMKAFNFLIISHEQWQFGKSLGEKFGIVLITDYSEKFPSKGLASYVKTNGMEAGAKIIRMGIEDYPYDDYVQLPEKTSKLKELLKVS